MKSYLILFAALFLILPVFSQNQNLSNGSVFDGEPYIVINPNNAEHIVVAWMGWAGVSDRIKIKTKVSFDSGLTWSDTIELPHVVSGYISADCSIAFNNNGSLLILPKPFR